MATSSDNLERQSESEDLEKFRGYLRFLARRHFPDGMRGKLDVSDIVQQTFLEAHRHRDQFRGSTESERAAWLRKILANCLAQSQRRLTQAKRDLARECPLVGNVDESSAGLERFVAANISSPSRHTARRESILKVAEVLADLPDKQRQAIVLHFFQDRNFTEVGAQLGCSVTNAIKLIHRGMKRVREAISASQFGATDA